MPIVRTAAGNESRGGRALVGDKHLAVRLTNSNSQMNLLGRWMLQLAAPFVFYTPKSMIGAVQRQPCLLEEKEHPPRSWSKR